MAGDDVAAEQPPCHRGNPNFKPDDLDWISQDLMNISLTASICARRR
jgi:hypothetical protein